MKTFTRAAIVLALGTTLMLSGCSSLDIDHEWDRSVDFSQYSTFTWIPQNEGPSGEQQLPEHLDIRLRRVVDDILLDKKGLHKAIALPQADLLLAYYIDVQKELRVDYAVYGSYYGGYGYSGWSGYGYGGAGYPGGGSVTKVREYSSGTLVLDIIDRKTKTLIWTGIIEGDAKHENPSGQRIDTVMTKMLKGFPPN